MIHNIIKMLDKNLTIPSVSAHCDIPCKIYDPAVAQISALTIIRMTDLIEGLEGIGSSKPIEYFSTLQRFVLVKEEHGRQLKEEIRVIWGDYFKQPQLEAFPEIHELTHSIMLLASKAKQEVDKEASLDLLDKVNQFAEIFWSTKSVDTYRANCPYPPAQEVVYPKLG